MVESEARAESDKKSLEKKITKEKEIIHKKVAKLFKKTFENATEAELNLNSMYFICGAAECGIENNARVVAAAVITYPRKLILSRSPQSEAIVKIAGDLATKDKSLPGVIAPQPEARIFARSWYCSTRKAYQQTLALRIHQLEAVSSLDRVSGYLRQAIASDRNLLTTWIQDFRREALGENAPLSESDRWFDSKLKQGSLYVWQDKTTVSMVAYGGKTPNGIRINTVYTPPEYRQNGYATACVAAISQQLLDRGYKYCFLYTDLSNPTSNSIYGKIGYQPVCDITDYSFLPL